MTKARDYGTVDILVNDTKVATFEGYAAPRDHQSEVTSEVVPLGKLSLKAGPNVVTFHIPGKNPASSGYLVGVEELSLKPAS